MKMFDRGQTVDKTPQLESVLTSEVREEIARGGLPVIRISSRMYMHPGEVCRYVEQAIYEKKVRVARGSMKRSERRLFRARTQEAGPSAADSVVDISFEQIPGHLYITDGRVIFTSSAERWEHPMDELLSVKPYLNAVKLQFGKEARKVFVPDGNLAATVLGTLRNAAGSRP